MPRDILSDSLAVLRIVEVIFTYSFTLVYFLKVGMFLLKHPKNGSD